MTTSPPSDEEVVVDGEITIEEIEKEYGQLTYEGADLNNDGVIDIPADAEPDPGNVPNEAPKIERGSPD